LILEMEYEQLIALAGQQGDMAEQWFTSALAG
jgi:hypothetical protein